MKLLLNNAGPLRGARGVLRNLTDDPVIKPVFSGKPWRPLLAGVMALSFMLGSIISRPALAYCVCDPSIPAACMCIAAWGDERVGGSCSCGVSEPINQHFGPIQDPIEDPMREWTDGELGDTQTWLLEGFFEDRILPALMQMTLQLSSVMMYQIAIVGPFLDAKHQMETQRLFGYMSAQAFKDYYPSEGLCTIGTIARSIQRADFRQPRAIAVLSQFSIRRQLLNANRVSNVVRGTLQDAYWRQWREDFCDEHDNGGTLENVCSPNVIQERINKDIDYGRTVAVPTSLQVEFGDITLTEHEEEIMALMSNLYSYETLPPIPPAQLRSEAGRNNYMDFRALIAKRSVAEQSIQAIVALKSPSPVTPESRAYLVALMREAGFTEDESDRLIGEDISYLDQMDLIARKLFQRPEFYVDLVDKPANVARKSVALQSISLMQKRELFKSALRSEAMISVLLELELIEAQRTVQNRVNAAIGN